MDARLQRRVQRYGWDRAAADYEPLWKTQLAGAREALLSAAALAPGERVLDVACGTGLVTLPTARAVGPGGRVVGVDLSDRMVDAARALAAAHGVANASFERMDAERLALPDAGFDVVLCALGLMYLPAPEQALREMRRVLRPGGRMAIAVWGERSACGWSAVFEIVDAEVASDVCPLFFRLGTGDALARLCARAGFEHVVHRRIGATLVYADADEACRAALVGGPVALAWSRFDAATRSRVCARYLAAIERWRHDDGYRVPGEFVIVSAATAG
jgi:ubiquinone/menaquinone biosynthesis C-methylase UbiE